jgi:hypothetical protein
MPPGQTELRRHRMRFSYWGKPKGYDCRQKGQGADPNAGIGKLGLFCPSLGFVALQPNGLTVFGRRAVCGQRLRRPPSS